MRKFWAFHSGEVSHCLLVFTRPSRLPSIAAAAGLASVGTPANFKEHNRNFWHSNKKLVGGIINQRGKCKFCPQPWLCNHLSTWAIISYHLLSFIDGNIFQISQHWRFKAWFLLLFVRACLAVCSPSNDNLESNGFSLCCRAEHSTLWCCSVLIQLPHRRETDGGVGRHHPGPPWWPRHRNWSCFALMRWTSVHEAPACLDSVAISESLLLRRGEWIGKLWFIRSTVKHALPQLHVLLLAVVAN